MPDKQGLLTYEEFIQLQRRNPKLKNATYQGYRSWVKKTRAKRKAASTGDVTRPSFVETPNSPWTYVPLSQAWNEATAMYPHDRTLMPQGQDFARQQAQSYVKSITDPLIAQITKSINQRAAAGMSALGGYTKEFAEMASQFAPQANQYYQEAINKQSAADASLADYAKSAGANLAAAYEGSLTGAVPEAAVNQVNAQVGGMGEASGNALGGLGSASLARLISDQASESTYWAGAPKLAMGLGQMEAGAFQRMLANEMSSRIGDITTQVPGMVENMMAQYRGDELQKAQMRATRNASIAQYMQSVRDRNLQTSIGKSNYDLQRDRFDWEKESEIHDTLANAQQSAAAMSSATGYMYKAVPIRDAKGKITGYRIAPVTNKKGNRVPTANTLTDQQNQQNQGDDFMYEIQTSLMQQAEKWATGNVVQVQDPESLEYGWQVQPGSKLTREQAAGRLRAAIISMARARKITLKPAQITSYVQMILNYAYGVPTQPNFTNPTNPPTMPPYPSTAAGGPGTSYVPDESGGSVPGVRPG